MMGRSKLRREEEKLGGGGEGWRGVGGGVAWC